jgi:hypothetical protein
MDCLTLWTQAAEAGLRVTADGDRLIVRGPRKAEPIAKALLEYKAEIMALLSDPDREPAVEEGLVPWMLWEWRRISILEWRSILQESVVKGDARREEYARWMLRDILPDYEYREPKPRV